MIYLLIALGIIQYMFAWGTWVAYFQGNFPTLAKDTYRNDVVVGALWSLIPGASIACIFCSGFLKYGWGFQRR